MEKIKVEIYHNGNPYNVSSSFYNPMHVENIIEYNLNKYSKFKNEIISQGGVMKINLSDCQKSDVPCIHYETTIHGLSEELEKQIHSMNLSELAGSL